MALKDWAILFVLVILFLTMVYVIIDNNQAFYQGLQDKGKERCDSFDYNFISVTKPYPKSWVFFAECNTDVNWFFFKYSEIEKNFEDTPIKSGGYIT